MAEQIHKSPREEQRMERRERERERGHRAAPCSQLSFWKNQVGESPPVTGIQEKHTRTHTLTDGETPLKAEELAFPNKDCIVKVCVCERERTRGESCPHSVAWHDPPSFSQRLCVCVFDS